MAKLSASELRRSHLTDDQAVVQRKIDKLVKDIEAGVIVPHTSRVRDVALKIARPAMRAGFERGFSPLYVRQIIKDAGAVILIKEIKIEYDAWLSDKRSRGEAVPPVTQGTVKENVLGEAPKRNVSEQGKTTRSSETESEYLTAAEFAEASIKVGDIPEDEERRESYVESIVSLLCSATDPKLASSLDVTEALEQMVVYASDLHNGRMKRVERNYRRQAVLACARPGVVSVETLEGLLSGQLGDRVVISAEY
jgi:hypothetical protein